MELVVIKEILGTPTSASPPPSTPTSGSASSAMPSIFLVTPAEITGEPDDDAEPPLCEVSVR
ncbi:hypothetical protein QF035_004213 [Streptomyces umbrinus]|uniref:Uncharacterized protein n=1 Tax=Streptomyces umbrinus TaxID=67370 RepID=A0ABU0ST18_9ACTN|nr:hypothetical protein [Streptomyces umbrinus]